MPKKSFSIFCLSFFTVSFGVAAMAAVIPSISAHFGVDQVYAAKLLWLYMLPYGIFAFFCANSLLHSFGVFLPIVSDVFGWNRATVAAALTLGLLGMGLPSPLWGILTSRFGPRILIIVGNKPIFFKAFLLCKL